jgi:hypothetical protein
MEQKDIERKMDTENDTEQKDIERKMDTDTVDTRSVRLVRDSGC